MERRVVPNFRHLRSRRTCVVFAIIAQQRNCTSYVARNGGNDVGSAAHYQQDLAGTQLDLL
jgi:hypothetical protein